MSDKKICEVCGRERGEMDDQCPGYGEMHWHLGYKIKAAILTPEVLRLIKAVREVTPFEWELQAAIRQVRALPFEKPAESNHTEKQQLPKKGGE